MKLRKTPKRLVVLKTIAGDFGHQNFYLSYSILKSLEGFGAIRWRGPIGVGFARREPGRDFDFEPWEITDKGKDLLTEWERK